MGIVQWPTLDFAFMYLVSFTCSPQIVIFTKVGEGTTLLMGAPAAGLLVKLQRVVRDECNPCSCFALPSLCIFRLWLSVNSIQAVLLKGRARKKLRIKYTLLFRLPFPPIQGQVFMVSKTLRIRANARCAFCVSRF